MLNIISQSDGPPALNSFGEPKHPAYLAPIDHALVRTAADTKYKEQILVVDDEQVTRLRLNHILSGVGYKVLEACNGRDALEIVKSTSIDLVLMDICMPVLDGFRTLRLLRQMHSMADLPVVMMTASDRSAQILEAFEDGASDYVSKPIDGQVAIARIRNQLLAKNAQRQLRESEERYALAARGTNDGMWDWNLATGELYLSPRWRSMLSIESPDFNPTGSQWMELIHFEDRRRVSKDLELHLLGETSHFETELRMCDSNGGYRWMLCRGLAVRDSEGTACRIAGSLTDITEGKVADGLTGLPNRILLRDRIQRCIEQLSRRTGAGFALIYMDMDDFKLINDNLGHDSGDEFLVGIARRLETTLRKSDAVIARLGGDEFAVLLENVHTINEAIAVAERMHEKLNQPFAVAEREMLTRASMGIVLATSAEPQDITAEILLSRADAAMYEAKKQSDVPYCVFREEMIRENAMRLELGGELRSAIMRDELSLYYQPIVGVAERAIVGFEALLRWHHPVHGNIPPSDFILIAEANGLIVEIGAWVLETACRQANQWRTEYQRDLMISVNVSVRQLACQDFAEMVAQTLAKTGLPPQLLKLEVTESLLMQDPENTIEILNRLRESGVTIGIDDFGTGYSSLSYLHQMPLDILKIDQSFVIRLEESEKHLAIICSIIALAKSLGLKVIAEGVETESQLLRLQEVGCHMMQGYYLARPQPAEIACDFIVKSWEWP
ncbi:GGDEF/EAL domain-containing response regulator [Planctomycetaceae bacterium SH139]